MASSDRVQKMSGEAFNRLKSDHEQFLEAYEKPTQIYRFLKARHSLRPLFLHRNLSYMRMHRSASGAKPKRSRKLLVNDLLQHTKDPKPDLATQIKSDNHLRISLSGLEKGIDFSELLEEASGSRSKPTNQSGGPKSHDSQLVELEILLYRFSQPSAEALLSGHKNSFHCTCSSLGKRVIEYSANAGINKATNLPLIIPESSLTWKGRERPGGTLMLVFRATHYDASKSNRSNKTTLKKRVRRKNRQKVTPSELNLLKDDDSRDADTEVDDLCQDDRLLEHHYPPVTNRVPNEDDISHLERFSILKDQVSYTDMLTGELVAMSQCQRNSVLDVESSVSAYESPQQPSYPLVSKEKPQMKDACVMTNIAFGTDDISELTPVYQSQIASLSSEVHKDTQTVSSCSDGVCNGSSMHPSKDPSEVNHTLQPTTTTRPASQTHSRHDKCTSPLIPKLVLRNGVLSCFVNGYAAPEITALRENGKKMPAKRKLFLSTKNRRASLNAKKDVENHQSFYSNVRQTSPMVCSAPEDDLMRLMDRAKVSTIRRSSLKRLGSGKQGPHSFLISLPRSHYDKLRNLSPNKTTNVHASLTEAQDVLQECESLTKNGLGKSTCKNSSQRRRTEIQLLLDGDKPRGQRVSADDIPMIMAEDVTSWSVTTPEKSSSWLGSSTRKITPVDHFSFPIPSVSPKGLSSGSISGSSLSGSLSNHRKRGLSEESESSSVTSPQYLIPPSKSARVSSSPSDMNTVSDTPLPFSNLPHCSVDVTNKQKTHDKDKELESHSKKGGEQKHSFQPSSLSYNSSHNSSNTVHTRTEDCLQMDEVFCAELVVFDSRGDCLLKNGEYSILMQKCTKSEDEKPEDLLTFEPLTWSSIFGGQNSKPSSRKSRNLLLSFSLSWADGPPQHQLCSDIDTALDLKKIRETYYPSTNPTPSADVPPKHSLSSSNTNSISPLTTDTYLLTQSTPQVMERESLQTERSTSSQVMDHPRGATNCRDSDRTNSTPMPMDVNSSLSLVPSGMQRPSSSSSKEKIVFNFLYGNNSLQQTECREDMQCPWCFLRCNMLYSLLKHMSLCHPRFHFTYSPSLDRAKVIDVHVNKLYDTSSSIERDPGERSSISLMKKRQRPSKCFPCTCVLVEKGPAVEIGGLSEFQNDGSWRRGFNSNRMYYHSTSCLPMCEEELLVDSDVEDSTLDWQKCCSQKMLDEFTDVNKGEKRLMKLWNLFVMENRLIAEKQIPLASVLFAQKNKDTILKEKIDRNFLSHLISLYDFGLLEPCTIRQCMSLLYGVG